MCSSVNPGSLGVFQGFCWGSCWDPEQAACSFELPAFISMATEKGILVSFFPLSFISLHCNWLVRNTSQWAIIEKLHKHELLSWLSCVLCLLSFMEDSPESELFFLNTICTVLFSFVPPRVCLANTIPHFGRQNFKCYLTFRDAPMALYLYEAFPKWLNFLSVWMRTQHLYLYILTKESQYYKRERVFTTTIWYSFLLEPSFWVITSASYLISPSALHHHLWGTENGVNHRERGFKTV